MNARTYVFLFAAAVSLAGCADQFSLDDRGPSAKGVETHKHLSLPPDYLLRAPEPASAETIPADANTPPPKTGKKKAAPVPVPKQAKSELSAEKHPPEKPAKGLNIEFQPDFVVKDKTSPTPDIDHFDKGATEQDDIAPIGE